MTHPNLILRELGKRRKNLNSTCIKLKPQVAEMAETETTPLLAGVGDNAPHIEHVPASARFHRTIKSLTAVILVISVLALLSLITEFVIVAIWPFRWYIIQPEVLLLIFVRTGLPSTLPSPPFTRLYQLICNSYLSQPSFQSSTSVPMFLFP